MLGYITPRFIVRAVEKMKKKKTFTSIVRATLKNNKLINHKIIYKADDKYYSTSTIHYGTRIVFDNEGYLYFSIGIF